MQATIPPKSLFCPKITPTTREVRKLSGFSKRNLSLSISAVSQNVTTPEAQDAIKRALAKRAVGLVKSGMVVGLGTGSTASIAIEELGRLIKQGKIL